MKLETCKKCGNVFLLEDNEDIKICDLCKTYNNLNEDKIELTNDILLEDYDYKYLDEKDNRNILKENYLYILLHPLENKLTISLDYEFKPNKTFSITFDKIIHPIEIRNYNREEVIIDLSLQIPKLKDNIIEEICNTYNEVLELDYYINFLDDILIKEENQKEFINTNIFLNILEKYFNINLYSEGYNKSLITYEYLIKNNNFETSSSGLLKDYFVFEDMNSRLMNRIINIKVEIEKKEIDPWLYLNLAYYDYKEGYKELEDIEDYILNDKKFSSKNSLILFYYHLYKDEIDNLFINFTSSDKIWLSLLRKNNNQLELINGLNDNSISIFTSFNEFQLKYKEINEEEVNSIDITSLYKEHFNELNKKEELKDFLFYIHSINKDDNKLINEEFLLEETNDFSKKRKKAESLVYKVLSTLDKSGINTKKYQNFFSSMSDAQFKSYVSLMKKEDDENFFLEVLPNKNEPTFDDIKASLDVLKVPMNEYMYFRNDGNKDNPIRTKFKVPIGYKLYGQLKFF